MTVQDTQWPDSLWRSTAEPVPDFDELNQDIETDLLIVGAGYTGLSTALHAVDHVKDIVIIDQAQPGWGCSGRNGGQIHVQWKPDLAALKQLYPGSQFETFIETMGAAVQLVFDLVEKYQIDCQTQRTGSVIAGKGTKAIRYLTEWSRFWAEAGEDVRLLDNSDTSELIGTAHYDRSMLDNRGGSLQPLAYSRGLAQACQERGITIYGNSRAIRIRPNGKGWQVSTPGGSVKCRRLVLATIGYTDNLWPGLSRTIVPVASMLTATCPLPKTVASTLLPKRQVVGEYAGVP
ncbi:MAG: FAD-binding oxidoreductase, partial [Arenicellales bacterium]|nr:FAD-binding oxidoreductase [Arenicellales bacterium]